LTHNWHQYERRYKRVGEKFVATGLLFILCAAQNADSSIQAFHRAFGPSAELLVASPTLQWEVWPSDGARVTSSEMTINGRAVDAVYNSRLKRLEYRPERPFSPGSYRVDCEVMVDSRLEVKKSWNFQVSSEAVPVLPPPRPDQFEGLRETNNYRRELGLPDAYQEDRLNAASLAHVKYLSLNHRTGHFEKSGEPGFVGATPSDRLAAFGYCGGSWECVSYNSGGLKESVRDLYNAPYHRIPFLQPGSVPIGTGMEGKQFSIKFGDSGQEGVSVSPAANQAGVPRSWDGNESPNPLRMHTAKPGTVGYPIVFSYFADEVELTPISATLTLNGRPVPVYVNSKTNDDHLENSIIIIPQHPLEPNTTYEASVEGIVNNKLQVQRTWTFSTGAR
jgi:hypothetical protein